MKFYSRWLASIFALVTLVPGCGDIKMPDVNLSGSDDTADTAKADEPAPPPERQPVLPPLPTMTPEQIIEATLKTPSANLTDADIAKLAALESGQEVIQELDLKSATISSAAFQSMLSFPALTKLDLQSSKLSDGQWEPLGKVASLEWLNLTKTGINNSVLPHLSELKTLKHLNLSETFVNDDGFAALTPLSSLEEISIAGTDVNGNFLSHLGSRGAKAKLKKIQAGRSNFGYQGFVFVKEFPSLTEIYASGVSATDASMEGLKRMTNLEVLEVENNQISDLGVPHIVTCSNLRELSLANNVGVTDRSLQRLSRLKNLVRLNLNGTNVSPAGAQKLKAELPDCVITVKDQEI